MQVDWLLARLISLKRLGRNDKPAAIRLIKWERLRLQLRLQVCSDCSTQAAKWENGFKKWSRVPFNASHDFKVCKIGLSGVDFDPAPEQFRSL